METSDEKECMNSTPYPYAHSFQPQLGRQNISTGTRAFHRAAVRTFLQTGQKSVMSSEQVLFN